MVDFLGDHMDLLWATYVLNRRYCVVLLPLAARLIYTVYVSAFLLWLWLNFYYVVQCKIWESKT
jgi:hypothetical protein